MISYVIDDAKTMTVYAVVAAGLYVGAWLYFSDFYDNARAISLRLPFMLGGILLTLTGCTLAITCSTVQATVAGIIGATAFFLSLVLHHPSTNIVVLGCAYSMALLVTLGGGGLIAQFAVFFFLWAVFGTCYLSCQKPVLAWFGGSNATTLFGLVLFAVLGAIYRLDLAPATAIARVTLLTIPASVMSTSYPDYLSDRSV